MKRWKRLLPAAVTLCLAMVLLFPNIGSSQAGVTVSIDAPAEVAEGTNFIARVNITEVTNFDACNYDIVYDPLILEVTDVTNGRIGGTVVPVEMWGFIPAGTQGTIRVIENVPGLAGVSGSGYLAEIHFHVVGSAGSTSDITPSNGVLSDNTATAIPVTWGFTTVASGYDLALISGWNLISLPLIPDSANIEDILAGIMNNVESVWAYDERWGFYAPGAPPDLTEMTCGKGYWVKVTAPCTLTIECRQPTLPYDIPLGSGWNLIGLPLIQEPQPIEDILAGITNNVESVWTYDSATGRWAFYAPGAPPDLTEMTHGKGYWVKVTDPCRLTIEGN